MAKKKSNENLPSEEDVKTFEMLFPMLNSDIDEIRELSKKKQDEPLNSFKVKIINKKLSQIKNLLANENSSQYLELLDEETLPTNSDAVLMLSQFHNALTQFKRRYHDSDGAEFGMFERHTWKTRD